MEVVAMKSRNVHEAVALKVNSTSRPATRALLWMQWEQMQAFNVLTSKLSLPPTLLVSEELSFLFLFFCSVCSAFEGGHSPWNDDTLWRGHNRLWHNVKSSQPNVRSSHCQQIESWAQLEGEKLWLIAVCPYRWKGWSGIVGSFRSGHQFVRKWKLRNSKASSARESDCRAGECVL